jgi:CBS domain-containing protein
MPRQAMPHISEVMSARPISMDAGSSLEAALDAMRSHAIHHLPVTSQGAVIGILHESHLRLYEQVARGFGWHKSLTAGDVCDIDVLSVAPDTPIDRVLNQMIAARRSYAVAVDGSGRLAGILTVTDVCGHFLEILNLFYVAAPESVS